MPRSSLWPVLHPHTRPVVPWNKGRFVGPKPPLKPEQVWAIRPHLQREQRLRDLAMCDLAIDSKLRVCDLVRLRIGQLVANASVRHWARVSQQQTGQPVQFELTEQTHDSLLAWFGRLRGGCDDYIFPGRAMSRWSWPCLRHIRSQPVRPPQPARCLRGETFIAFARVEGPGMFDATLAACLKAGFSPRVGQEAPRMDSMRHVQMDGAIYRQMVEEDCPAVPLHLATRRGMGAPVIRNFIDLVRRAAREREQQP